jgi:hypothetical protein
MDGQDLAKRWVATIKWEPGDPVFGAGSEFLERYPKGCLQQGIGVAGWIEVAVTLDGR